MQPKARQRGFTLIEILLSVALMALVIMLAYGSIRVALQASRSGEQLIERSEEMRSAQGFLRRQLSQMLPTPFERLDDGGEQKSFEGDAHGIRFVAPMPGYLSRGGPHVQELTLVRARGGYQLEFRHAQLNGFDPADGIDPDQVPVVLIDGIRDGEFSFRRIEPEGDISDWLSDWDEPSALPLILRLDLEFDRGDRRDWVEFEVAGLAASAGMGGGIGGNVVRGGMRRPPSLPRDRQ